MIYKAQKAQHSIDSKTIQFEALFTLSDLDLYYRMCLLILGAEVATHKSHVSHSANVVCYNHIYLLKLTLSASLTYCNVEFMY